MLYVHELQLYIYIYNISEVCVVSYVLIDLVVSLSFVQKHECVISFFRKEKHLRRDFLEETDCPVPGSFDSHS